MIIYRHIIKEICQTTLLALGLLLGIMVVNQFIFLLAKTAGGVLGVGFIFKLISYLLPQFVGMLLPIAFFMSIVWVYGRMWADNEMLIWLSSGFSFVKLVALAMVPMLIILPLVGLFTLYLGPKASSHYDNIMSDAKLASLMDAITPGRFLSVDNGKTVIYVEKRGSHDKLKNVFIAKASGDKAKGMLLYSRAGHVGHTKNQGDYMVLEKGYRYAGLPGKRDFQTMHYGQYWMKLADGKKIGRTHVRSLPSIVLFTSSIAKQVAEFNWRLAFLVMLPVLTILATCVSPVAPRKSRYSKLLPAVIILLVYYNLLLLNKAWLEDGHVPVAFGFWSVHVLALMIAIFYLIKTHDNLMKN